MRRLYRRVKTRLRHADTLRPPGCHGRFINEDQYREPLDATSCRSGQEVAFFAPRQPRHLLSLAKLASSHLLSNKSLHADDACAMFEAFEIIMQAPNQNGCQERVYVG